MYCEECGDIAFYVRAGQGTGHDYHTVKIDGDVLCGECMEKAKDAAADDERELAFF